MKMLQCERSKVDRGDARQSAPCRNCQDAKRQLGARLQNPGDSKPHPSGTSATKQTNRTPCQIILGLKGSVQFNSVPVTLALIKYRASTPTVVLPKLDSRF